MMLDNDLLCSDDQTLAFNIGNAASTNVIDLTKVGLGRGEPIKVFCQMTADFDSSGDTGTLQIKLQTDSAAAFNVASVDLVDTGALAQATVVKGYRPIDIYLPNNVKRYLRFYYTVGTANGTGGTITAGLILDQQTNDDPVALGLTS